MRKVEIKNMGLIKSAHIDLKKVNIIIGENFRTELLKIFYWLFTIERKYFEYKSRCSSIDEPSTPFKDTYSSLIGRVQQDLTLADDGYIVYESDYLKYKIEKSGLTEIEEKPDVEAPDSYFWNTTTYFPINRDLSWLNKEWLDPFGEEEPLLRQLSEFVNSKKWGSDLNDPTINIMSLRDWGFGDDYLRINEEGEFVIVRKVPASVTKLSSGLEYAAPIWMMLKYLENRIVNSLYIDLPEHGLFQPKAQLLMRNIIDDFVLRKSNASDEAEARDYQVNLFITTNSDVIIDTVLEYKELSNEVGLLAIDEIPDHPLEYEVRQASEETLDDVYSGQDPFYNINSI